MPDLLDSVEFFPSGTPGTGNVTPGLRADEMSLLPSEAGVVSNRRYWLRFEDGSDFEITDCGWTGTVFTRDRVIRSKISGVISTSTKMTMTSTAKCKIVQPTEGIYTRNQIIGRLWLLG